MTENKKTKTLVKNKKGDKKRGHFKTRAQIRVERFIVEELDRYIRIHKRHEKDLRYIG